MPAVRTSASSSVSNTVGDVARQVLEVHVVDRVGERALEAERPRGAEARAVLDVAPLAAVVPVHRRDLVAVRARRRWRSCRAHRRDRREGRDAVVDVGARAPSAAQRRRAAGRHRPLEHRGLHRVDDREDELLAAATAAHRRIRSPAYFSPSRRRPPTSSQTSPPSTRSASGGNRIDSAGGDERGALGVERQRAGGLGVEPARGRGRTARRGRDEAERRARRADDDAGADRWPRSASEPAAHAARRADRDAPPGRSAAAGARRASRPGAAAGEVERQRTSTSTRAGTATARGTRSRCRRSRCPTSAEASAPTSSTGRNGPDADGGRDAGALEEVEDEVHAR